jgi:hypothetical protein
VWIHPQKFSPAGQLLKKKQQTKYINFKSNRRCAGYGFIHLKLGVNLGILPPPPKNFPPVGQLLLKKK